MVKDFPLGLESRQRWLLSLLILAMYKVLAHTVRQEKEVGSIRIRLKVTK